MEIIAHRGASFDAPENTLEAVRLAWTQGADAVECDVQLTADGRLLVFHDVDTRRLARAPLVVAEATLAELTGLDVGGWKSPAFTGVRPPSLEQVLAIVPPGKRVFIEVKGTPEAVPELRRCVESCRLATTQIAIISFDLATCRAAQLQLPGHEVCWIMDFDDAPGTVTLQDLIRTCTTLKLNGLDLESKWPMTASFVRRVHDAGLRLYTWTVDDPQQAQSLAEAGLDGITTNRPGFLRDNLR